LVFNIEKGRMGVGHRKTPKLRKGKKIQRGYIKIYHKKIITKNKRGFLEVPLRDIERTFTALPCTETGGRTQGLSDK
jgi:hypothetical protein